MTHEGLRKTYEDADPDVMDQIWCCLTCFWKGRFGQLLGLDVVRCPVCRSADLSPASGESKDLDFYCGERGTLQ